MGIPAFTEPISIYSNINKGYGCFSMTSSTQKEALRYKVYLPKDYGIYYSIP
jgi:hypothetical protein